MILPGRPTGMAYLRPLSGGRGDAGARPARPLMPERSPLAPASSAPRSVGTLGSAACRSTTWSPSTPPRRRPARGEPLDAGKSAVGAGEQRAEIGRPLGVGRLQVDDLVALDDAEPQARGRFETHACTLAPRVT